MKVVPIAAESLGTRSMATFVETDDVKILIDPGAALGPLRYRLPPHPLEEERLAEHWKEIIAWSSRIEVLCVTHYHYDHHNPDIPALFKGKEVFLKHPTQKINKSQKGRAKDFLGALGSLPRSVEYSDGKEFTFGDTVLKFSPPVFHGTSDKLGYVTEVSVRDGDSCFIHTSDVEGPTTKEQTGFILEEGPDLLYVDGPMTYMLGYRFSHEDLRKAIGNLQLVMEKTPVKTIMADHHLLRDLKWKERMAPVLEAADGSGVRVCTAAEYLGRENDLLEARRKELYASG